MPRYFFHIVHADERQNDPVGVDLPGDQSAFDHAVDMLRRLLRTPSGQRLSPTYSMEVTDDHGRFLFSVPLDLPIVQQRDGG
jgi:hypothetical protein